MQERQRAGEGAAAKLPWFKAALQEDAFELLYDHIMAAVMVTS